MREKCVSVIVPVYNSVQYLEQCIESIIHQTYQNIQILLVDDGSVDESGRICDEFAQKDNRIEVYHVENRGVSATRNYGIYRAKGDYIQFVDSDDAIKPDMLQIMVDKIEKTKSDMVVCNYIKIFPTIQLKNERLERAKSYTNTAYLKNTLRDPGHHYYGVIWNKLYKADIIKDNKLMFKTDINLGEDFIYNLSYIVKCKKITVIKDHLYLYNKQQEKTLSSNTNKTINDCRFEFECRQELFKWYKAAFKKLGIYDKCKEKIYFYWIIFYIRQWHDTKYAYKNWTTEEKNFWKEQLEKDENIRKSIQVVPKKRINAYAGRYYCEYMLKYIVKKMLRFK